MIGHHQETDVLIGWHQETDVLIGCHQEPDVLIGCHQETDVLIGCNLLFATQKAVYISDVLILFVWHIYLKA